MTDVLRKFSAVLAATLAVALIGVLLPGPVRAAPAAKLSDYIVAVVNSELVTNFEVEQRMARVREEAARNNSTLPPPDELRKQVLNSLIDERVIITYARDSGVKVEDPEIDRAIANVAAANQLTVPALRERLKAEGLDYTRFRANLRDQLLAERVREREVQALIKVSDADVDAYLEKERASKSAPPELNIAQILVTVPDGASPAQLAQRQARAGEALTQLKASAPFDQVAKAFSEDPNRDKGGELGMKSVDRLPDLFVNAVKDLKVGQFTPELLRSGAGFHILKLLARSDPAALMVTQTHARHILLRLSPQLSAQDAARRLSGFRDDILAGRKTFEELARQYSDDGSATEGGDLGWSSPGGYVPEFEQAMDKLAIGEISQPVQTRFGVHLIQVIERREVAIDPKQAREQARNALREQKFDAAYTQWVADLRAKAYIELRDPPQ
jgi:peptidyl-prolyl cis-trans isomerase SurA